MADVVADDSPSSEEGSPVSALLIVPATPPRVARLRLANVLDATAYARALALISLPRSAQEWRRLASAGALGLGTLLVAAATVYLFAFNWALMGRLVRFGILASGLVATAAAAIRLGLHRLEGRLVIAVGALLVGLLLASVGQAYPSQTPAWVLFAVWAVLVVPWVAAARFGPLWVAEVGLVNLALAAWWDARLGLDPPPGLGAVAALVTGAANSAALLAWGRTAVAKAHRRRDVTSRALALGVLAPLVFGLTWWVADGDAADAVNGALALVGSVALAAWLVRRRRDDLFTAAMAGLGVTVVATVAVGRVVVEVLGLDTLGFLLSGVTVVVLVTAVTAWLRRLRRDAS